MLEGNDEAAELMIGGRSVHYVANVKVIRAQVLPGISVLVRLGDGLLEPPEKLTLLFVEFGFVDYPLL